MRKTALKRNKPMRRSRPKSTPIRQSARGEECTLQIPLVCNGNRDTVVLCHSNRLMDGKGAALKAPDNEACYGCSACHDVLDGRKTRPAWLSYDELQELFDRARERTQVILKRKGLM